ncbi:MAG: ABC transporter permease [Azospirillaceae bacterium]|nr:ABC transporter permease [Azospirillaceae bacterium]
MSSLPRLFPASDATKGTEKMRIMAVFKRWEFILVLILAAICVFNSFASPYFLDLHNLFDSTQSFSEKAILVLSMALIIIIGDIDLSVASIIALCGTAVGWLATQGMTTPQLVVASVIVGTLAGMVNGGIIVRFQVPAIVVTIGTMSLFRGISYIILGDQAFSSFPDDFSDLGQGYLGGMIPYEFIVYLVLAVVFAVFLHRTTYGRSIFAMGNNPQAAMYSGIKVDTIRFWLFTVNGMMAGLAAVLFTSRIGATRPNMALGWELEVVATVVLGGVAITGGSGTMPGVILSVFVFGMLTFGLGLVNVPGIIMTIITGCMLIGAIATPIIVRKLSRP